jgi:hypothetical protein
MLGMNTALICIEEDKLSSRIPYSYYSLSYRSRVMLEQNKDEIDYENIDDLPWFDHIEWMSFLTEKAVFDQQTFQDWEIV